MLLQKSVFERVQLLIAEVGPAATPVQSLGEMSHGGLVCFQKVSVALPAVVHLRLDVTFEVHNDWRVLFETVVVKAFR